MTLLQRFQTWQVAADHHASSYLWLAIEMFPFCWNKQLKITRVRAIQTWLETPSGIVIKVTYKRAPAFDGRRIEIIINGMHPYYFGPNDAAAIRALLGPL
jgi:hypothetical protein